MGQVLCIWRVCWQYSAAMVRECCGKNMFMWVQQTMVLYSGKIVIEYGWNGKGRCRRLPQMAVNVHFSPALGVLTKSMIPRQANESPFQEQSEFKADQWCCPIDKVPIDWLVEQKRCWGFLYDPVGPSSKFSFSSSAGTPLSVSAI